MSETNEEKVARLWKELMDNLITLHVSLIKIRNHLPNGSLKKNMIKDIDNIRSQINSLELGSRGK